MASGQEKRDRMEEVRSRGLDESLGEAEPKDRVWLSVRERGPRVRPPHGLGSPGRS